MIVELLTGVVNAFNKVFFWKTGGRERDDNAIRSQAEHWEMELREANRLGDHSRMVVARDNLRRLRDQARAKN